MTAHRDHGRALLAALKHTTTPGGPALALPVTGSLSLRPVGTAAPVPGDPDVGRLTDWRNRHVGAVLTEFVATRERTAAWLRDQVGPDEGRIVFMADEPGGRTFGYLGLAYIDWAAGSFEADGVVRGQEGPPGRMTAALSALMRWAVVQLGLHEPRVRVRSDNPRAVGFYRRLGFEPVARRPLRRIVEPGMVSWVEDESVPPGGPALVHMVWRTGGQDRA